MYTPSVYLINNFEWFQRIDIILGSYIKFMVLFVMVSKVDKYIKKGIYIII